MVEQSAMERLSDQDLRHRRRLRGPFPSNSQYALRFRISHLNAGISRRISLTYELSAATTITRSVFVHVSEETAYNTPTLTRFMLVGPCARSQVVPRQAFSRDPQGTVYNLAHCNALSKLHLEHSMPCSSARRSALPGLSHRYGALRCACPLSLSPPWNPTTANTQHAPCRLGKNHTDVIVLLLLLPDSFPASASPYGRRSIIR
ncbi:hypothetical protein BDW22DRAFT_875490 [Trametopsis cervina]|nr:hypothetical protein BDW22DRAFT_875490 [Trametopsis cervina]